MASGDLASLRGLEDRVGALQKINQELERRLVDAERTLQNQLADHEAETEEMQTKLDEVKSELMATKREEKELRVKERTNTRQIQLLETESAKLMKALDSSRGLFQNLQRQYADQCAESEKYRNSLRQKEQESKDLKESSQLHEIEVQKWVEQCEALEDALHVTEQELVIARQVQTELEVQKQDNLVLKETIDRERVDLDEQRILYQIKVQELTQQRKALEAAHLVTGRERAIAHQARTELENQKQENLVLKETISRVRFDLDELGGLCGT